MKYGELTGIITTRQRPPKPPPNLPTKTATGAPAREKPKQENACQTPTEQRQKNIPPHFPTKTATTSPQKNRRKPFAQPDRTTFTQPKNGISYSGKTIHTPPDNTDQTRHPAQERTVDNTPLPNWWCRPSKHPPHGKQPSIKLE